jgi:hypothetical protein
MLGRGAFVVKSHSELVANDFESAALSSSQMLEELATVALHGLMDCVSTLNLPVVANSIIRGAER